MANGTITGSTGNQYIAAKVIWSSVADEDANKSTVTAKLYYKRLNDYTTYGTGTFAITLGGNKISANNYVNITNDDWALALEVSDVIEHDSDGSKEITISATGSISGTTLSSTSVSGKAVLDTIPRASEITSADGVTLGNACSIKWTPLSKSFRYKLKFALGSWNYTTGAIHPNQTSAYIYTDYVIPLTVANQITDAKTGTMKVTLYTYSNSSATTQVGDASSDTFTVKVPGTDNTKPTVTMELTAVNSLGSSFAGLYIQGLSKVQADISATAKYSASIESYKLYAGGKSYGDPYLTDYLSTVGTVTVKGRAYDSRGYYKDVSKDIEVLSYSPPQIAAPTGESSVVCARCYADGTLAENGTYLRIRAKRSYSKLTVDGVQRNFCEIRYRYRPESTKTYSDWITLLAADETGADTVDSGAIPDVVSSIETAYFVQIGVVDGVGETDAIQITVATDFLTVDVPEEYKGRSIGIFRHAVEPADGENRIDINGTIHGGGIDNLTLGTMLTATAEAPITLADILTPGCYYSPNATNTQYITDSPYKEGGFGLEVRELQHKDYIRQTINYGRTTIWRHYNGSEWSDWVRVMVSTEFDSAATDFVIEQGESGGWTYKKWKGGTYEMFGTFEVTPGSSTLHTSLYRSDSMSITPPFAITSAYVSGSAVGHYCITNAGISSGGNVILRIMSDEALSTSTSIEVRLHVVGTY